jgi:hypothetical protein
VETNRAGGVIFARCARQAEIRIPDGNPCERGRAVVYVAASLE